MLMTNSGQNHLSRDRIMYRFSLCCFLFITPSLYCADVIHHKDVPQTGKYETRWDEWPDFFKKNNVLPEDAVVLGLHKNITGEPTTSFTCPNEDPINIEGDFDCLTKYHSQYENTDKDDRGKFDWLWWLTHNANCCSNCVKNSITFMECGDQQQEKVVRVSHNLSFINDDDNTTMWARKITPGQKYTITIDLGALYMIYGFGWALHTAPINYVMGISNNGDPVIDLAKGQLNECSSDTAVTGGICKSWQLKSIDGMSFVFLNIHQSGQNLSPKRFVGDKMHLTLPDDLKVGNYSTNYHIIKDLRFYGRCACHKGKCDYKEDGSVESPVEYGYSCTCDEGYTGFLCTECLPGYYSEGFGDNLVCHPCNCGPTQNVNCSFEGDCSCDPTKAPHENLTDMKCETPYILDIQPRYSIINGGTKVKVTGGLLHNWEVPEWLNCPDHGRCPDSDSCSSWTELDCVTTKLAIPRNYSVASRDLITGANEAIDFDFKPNPNITSVSPLSAISSGGIKLTIKGSDFDVVQSVMFHYMINCPATGQSESLRNATSCTVLSSSIMYCDSPNATDAVERCESNQLGRRKRQISSVDIFMGLTFDGYDMFKRFSDIPRLKIYSDLRVAEDPDIFHWQEFLLSLSQNDDIFGIPGERMDSGVTIDDYEIIIAGERVVNDKLSSKRLTAKVPKHKPTGRTEVRVGNIIKYVGELKYDSIWPYIIGSILVLVLIVVLAIAIFFCRRKKSETALIKGKTIDEETELKEGRYHGYKTGKGSAVLSIPNISEELKPWMIPRGYVKLSSMLGQGQFGRVHKGMLDDPKLEKPIVIAVKTLKAQDGDLTDTIVEQFLEEATLMSNFNHANVLGLVGVVYDDEIPLVLLPFMEHGDLKSLLRKPNEQFSLGDLMHFSLQVSRGMEYLASTKFIHRDLAARNCVVSSEYLVKVADFGLSHDIYESDYYQSDDVNSRPLPVKWMAIESLESGRYTIQSDVILTRGASPYNIVNNYEIRDYLQGGERLECPAACPEDLYELMLKCWSKEPESRPSFSEICTELQALLYDGGYQPRQKTSTIPTDYYLVPTVHYLEIIP